ncbi:MAG: methyl-accepting chemotaxis protein [Oscillospiraceae bacterium]|nr:methyl-accepting chemotaxis protein [Oscillospiraceae bacterium]
MKRFRDIKIGSKLVFSYLLLIAVFAISLVATLIGLHAVSTDMEEFYQQEFQIVQASQNMKTDLQDYAKGISRLAVAKANLLGQSATDSGLYLQQKKDEMQASFTNLGAEIDVLSGFTLQSVEEFETIVSTYSSLQALNGQLLDYYSAGRIDEALTLANGRIDTVGTTLGKALDVIIERAAVRANDKYTRTISLVQTLELLSILLSVLLLGVAVWLCIVLTRAITRPLREMEEAAARLADGDLSQEIRYRSTDELGSLAESLRTTIGSLHVYIQEIEACMSAIGHGKLNYQTNVEFRGDFISIKNAIDSITANLTGAIMQINVSADQVMRGAEQIAGGGQALSQATLEQASSVEELSVTINEVSDRVRENAETAVATSRLSDHVGDEIMDASSQMQRMSDAMSQMKAMSSQITGIIKDIEDIAFQTNILSLNAAVEAARAGEAGKGFSVVANEIRRLSDKTTEASKSTGALIGRTIDQIMESVEQAKTTSAKLAHVATSAREAAKQVESISSASNDQATAIVQLRESIAQISSVVQENSATAEESAASSEELTGQMEMLKELVSTFEYDV